MIHRTHHQPVPLERDVAASDDAFDALLSDLAAVRARPRSMTRPFVTLAYAQSVDGSITIARGQRCTLSGPESMRLTHALRASHDAILVGVGTVLADDPELRVRLVDGRHPQPVIVDSQLRTPPAARLMAQAGRQLWIGTTDRAVQGSAERRARIEARGGRVFACPARPDGWVDLPALLGQLHDEGIEHVMVEGGARIITSFLEARLVDYAVITIAPLFMGGLSAVERLAPSPLLAHGPPRLGRWITARLGDDLVLGGEIACRAG